ncbi:hypothetical protein NDU88_003848 [Pleurodeles waltl]|uniref:Uncharacterized protein n=1 Tax=Pleurodeles waltl TaxID=8319 RepID=A0AAV7KXM7_PLEWA|nr:hypothetical protein NDU88_003848 [Pleurodeles waltl]
MTRMCLTPKPIQSRLRHKAGFFKTHLIMQEKGNVRSDSTGRGATALRRREEDCRDKNIDWQTPRRG